MNQKTEPDRAYAGEDAMQAVMRPWLEYWTQLLEQRGDWAEMMLASAPPNVDLKTLQKRWLDTLSKSLDAYLRTPAFLESMRKNLDAMTAWKTTSDLAQREATRQAGMPHVEDISGLYERLQMAHEVTMEKLSEIDRRLADLERQVAADKARKEEQP